jgi:hypothetical protein
VLVHVETFLDFATALCDLRVDLVNVVVHVHTVSDRRQQSGSLDCRVCQSEDSASSLFRLMDRRVAGPTGDPNSERAKSGADRGERCAASRAFNGSNPTANLVSIIKGQWMS